jgi:hypothetical protein
LMNTRAISVWETRKMRNRQFNHQNYFLKTKNRSRSQSKQTKICLSMNQTLKRDIRYNHLKIHLKMMAKNFHKKRSKRNSILNVLNISESINVDFSQTIMMAYASIANSISSVAGRNNTVYMYILKKSIFKL